MTFAQRRSAPGQSAIKIAHSQSAARNPDEGGAYSVTVNGTDYKAIDKVVGIILAAFSLCGTLCGGFLLLGGAAVATISGSQAAANPETQSSLLPAAVAGVMVGAVGFVIFACYMLNILGAIGVMKSRRWGFILTAIFTAISGCASFSGATGWIDLIPIWGTFIYCVLRLTGNLGQAPD